MCQVRYASSHRTNLNKMAEISRWLSDQGRRADNSMLKLNHMGDVLIDDAS
jgi:hypothetical protein